MGNKSSAGGSSNSAPPPVGEQLCDSVYLLHGPRDQEPPQVEVVFIHGLQACNYKDAYWKTWLVRDGSKFPSNCWPASWLKERMPRARILSLSYDSSALVAPIKGNKGTMDLDNLGESLLQEMLIARIGQNDCPVVFVCHSLGGLVVKSIVIHARKPSTFADEYKALLQNTKGFFFYATPHLGSELVEYAKKISTLYNFKGAVVENLEVLCKNTSDLNTGFDQAQRGDFQHWKCYVIGESHNTELCRGIYKRVVSTESAKLFGVDYMEVREDHVNVCKPKTPTDTSFLKLVEFIKGVCPELLLTEIHEDLR